MCVMRGGEGARGTAVMVGGEGGGGVVGPGSVV